MKCGATVDIHSGGVAELAAAEADNDHASSLSNEEMQALESSTFMLSLPLHVAYLQRTPCPSNMATNSQLRWNHVSLSNVLQLSFLYNKPTFTINAADPSQLTANDLHDGGECQTEAGNFKLIIGVIFATVRHISLNMAIKRNVCICKTVSYFS